MPQFPTPGLHNWICKGFSALEAGSYANKELASQPVSGLFSEGFSSIPGAWSPVSSLYACSPLQVNPLPQDQPLASALTPAGCRLVACPQSPPSPVYRPGGLFPLTLKTSEIDPPSPPSSLGPCRNLHGLSCFRLYPCSMPTAPQFCFGIWCFLCQTFVAWHRGLQHQLRLSS